MVRIVTEIKLGKRRTREKVVRIVTGVWLEKGTTGKEARIVI